MEKTTQIRPFLETLREIRHGDCLDELAINLNDLVAAVRATGKKGELILKLSVSPAGSGKVETVDVADDIILKLPQLPKPSTLFFTTEDNGLQRQDPRQRAMELEPVPSAKKEAATA